MKRAHGRKQGQHAIVLAYGSNLCPDQMLTRCPSAVALEATHLIDHALQFRTVADVAIRRGSTVPVVAWRVTTTDLLVLDRFEGVRSESPESRYGAYRREYVEWGDLPCFLYVKNGGWLASPTTYYAGVVRRGYRHFGLDERVLDAAIEQAELADARARIERAEALRSHRAQLPPARQPRHERPAPSRPLDFETWTPDGWRKPEEVTL